MMRNAILLMLLLAGLGGCAAGGAQGTLAVAFADDAAEPVRLEASGVWVQQAGNGSWLRVVDHGAAWELNGTGSAAALEAGLPPGQYERIRVVFANVSASGEAAILSETGFELPLDLLVRADETTRVLFSFAWTDALFRASEGLAFVPALAALDVEVGQETVMSLVAKEIDPQATPPVARIEAFDAVGLRFFQSDFVAESPSRRMIATGPNLTFQASSSEAVADGASLTGYLWDFGDGTTAEGATVDHDYPLSGGNFTIRLTVTDSEGATDAQTIKVALRPGTFTAKDTQGGTVTGTYPRSCSSSSDGTGMQTHTVAVDASMTTEGVPADLIGLQVSLFADGNPHAGADIDLRVLAPDGSGLGSGSSDGTSEKVTVEYAPGEAASGDYTMEVRPCAALDQDYKLVTSMTWLAKGPQPGYVAWLDAYDDGHDHEH